MSDFRWISPTPQTDIKVLQVRFDEDPNTWNTIPTIYVSADEFRSARNQGYSSLTPLQEGEEK